MNEINNIEQLEELPLDNKHLEQMNELSDTNSQIQQLEETIELISNNETLNFINECNMSIFDFTKDKTNEVILTPKLKTIKKKYKLFQYNLNINEFVYISKFTTFTEITNYLENLEIKINLKTLIKNKLLKIELI
jgi:hypothetical protein